MFCRRLQTLTHVDVNGKAAMVNVKSKLATKRIAVAQGRVLLGQEAFQMVLTNQIKKGDVLAVAKIAGIQAAKQTGMLIPLCHPLSLDGIQVDCTLNDVDFAVAIQSTVSCEGKTGVEMEAIMAVSVAACTIYDMCKAVNKGIVISDIQLISKSGGQGGDYNRE